MMTMAARSEMKTTSCKCLGDPVINSPTLHVLQSRTINSHWPLNLPSVCRLVHWKQCKIKEAAGWQSSPIVIGRFSWNLLEALKDTNLTGLREYRHKSIASLSKRCVVYCVRETIAGKGKTRLYSLAVRRFSWWILEVSWRVFHL